MSYLYRRVMGKQKAKLPAMPSADAEARFVWGDSGPWDTGLCGNLTYAVTSANWKYAMAFSWYAFWQENGLNRPSAGSNCNAFQRSINVLTGLSGTGLASAIDINRGTVNRLKAQQPNALIGFYITLLQIANTAGLGLAVTATWPRSRSLWDADWDALGASSWSNSDIGANGKYLTTGASEGLKVAAAREMAAQECADIVRQAKAENPATNVVFSDNFSSLVSDTDWAYECDSAARFCSKVRDIGVTLIPNVTSAGMRGASIDGSDMSARWDLLARAGVSGIYQEGITHAHAVRDTLFLSTIVPNIQNWISRAAPGGGKMALLCHPVTAVDDQTNIFYGSCRRLTVSSASAIDANTIEINTATPHFIDDTSYPLIQPQNVHAAINGVQYFPVVVDADTFRITATAHGISIGAITLGSPPWIHFPSSANDVDFGLIHALRSTGDATFVHWNPDAIYANPLWANDLATFGQVEAGSLAVVSSANVTDSNGNTYSCVKEIKYHFLQGPVGERWHHVRFDMEGRRRWKAAA